MAERTTLTGWGRTPRSVAELHRPRDTTEIHLTDHPRGQLARGLGRSYGDAALNAGGLVWDTTTLTSLDIDQGSAFATVGAGVTFLDLLRAGVPHGLFPPVTPGTKYVTMGGAIAADVHGKNHHCDGSLGDHIESLTMLTGNGEMVTSRPGDDLFSATLGGMGLTGIIVEATIRLIRLTSSRILVDTLRTVDLAETLDVMTARDSAYRYSVSWVDLTHGTHPGRGVVTFGDHAQSGDPKDWKPSRSMVALPDILPSGVVNRATVKAFNELFYRRAPRQQEGDPQTIDQFFYPLDVARHWNRLYGKAGLIQYQMVVPFGCEDILEGAIAEMGSAPVPPSLAVLKRMGEGRGLLAFPIPGWTLAVDFPASHRGLNTVLDRIDERVAEAGGRVYLAKDSRLRPSMLPKMYPDLDRWREMADKADPLRRFRSDLDRRLGLRGP